MKAKRCLIFLLAIALLVIASASPVDAATWDYVNYTEDFVDQISDLHPADTDIGTHAGGGFAEMQDKDGTFDLLTEANTGGGGIDESDYVNGDAATLVDAVHVGTGSPYFLDTVDATEYLDITKGGGYARWYPFGDTSETFTDGSITLYIYVIYGDGNDDLDWFIDTTGDDTGEFNGQIANPTSGWYDTGVITGFDSNTEYNAARMQLTSIASGQHLDHEIDAAYIRVTTAGGDNFDLDLEVGWTTADYDETVEYLCIFGGTQGSEALRVDIWTGSWTNLDTDVEAGWNNYSIASYLDDATVEIRFTDTTGDAVEADTWEIEGVMLQTWSYAYTEIQYEGIGFADTDYLSFGASKTLFDAIGLADTDYLAVGRSATLYESVGLADTIYTVFDAVVTFYESVGVADIVYPAASIIAVFFEAIGLADIVYPTTGGNNYEKYLFEVIGFADTDYTLVGTEYIKNLYERIGFADIIESITGGNTSGKGVIPPYRPIPEFLRSFVTFLAVFAPLVLAILITIWIIRFIPDAKVKLLMILVVWIALLALIVLNMMAIWSGGAG